MFIQGKTLSILQVSVSIRALFEQKIEQKSLKVKIEKSIM